jgi:hypothetical protein
MVLVEYWLTALAKSILGVGKLNGWRYYNNFVLSKESCAFSTLHIGAKFRTVPYMTGPSKVWWLSSLIFFNLLDLKWQSFVRVLKSHHPHFRCSRLHWEIQQRGEDWLDVNINSGILRLLYLILQIRCCLDRLSVVDYSGVHAILMISWQSKQSIPYFVIDTLEIFWEV